MPRTRSKRVGRRRTRHIRHRRRRTRVGRGKRRRRRRVSRRWRGMRGGAVVANQVKNDPNKYTNLINDVDFVLTQQDVTCLSSKTPINKAKPIKSLEMLAAQKPAGLFDKQDVELRPSDTTILGQGSRTGNDRNLFPTGPGLFASDSFSPRKASDLFMKGKD